MNRFTKEFIIVPPELAINTSFKWGKKWLILPLKTIPIISFAPFISIMISISAYDQSGAIKKMTSTKL